MKLDNHIKLNDAEKLAIETQVQKRQQQEYKLLGSHNMKIYGGKIFEYDPTTGEVSEAKYRISDEYVLGGNNSKKLDTKKGCIYVEALNAANAVKRLKRGSVIFKA
jgi:hypothetical protein